MGEGVSEVMSQALVTSFIHMPMLLASHTIHIARKALMVRGDQAVMGGVSCSSILRNSFIGVSRAKWAGDTRLQM
ncbi:hypothetical protein D9M69_492150 [compost metagenome]